MNATHSIQGKSDGIIYAATCTSQTQEDKKIDEETNGQYN